MKEVFDYGTGVPYTHEDLEVLFRGKVEKRKEGPSVFRLYLVRRSLRRALSGPCHMCEMGEMRKMLFSGRKGVSRRIRELSAF